jgi:hypothetical protein
VLDDAARRARYVEVHVKKPAMAEG